MEKYQDLRREVARLWRVNVSVMHVVVGALGMVTKNLQRSLQQIGVTVRAAYMYFCRKRHCMELQEFCEKFLRREATGRSLPSIE